MHIKKIGLLIVILPCLVSLLYPNLLHAREELPIIEEIKIDLIKRAPEIKIASNISIEYLDYTLERPSRIIIDPLGVVYSNLDEEVFSGDALVRAVSIVKTRGSIPRQLSSDYYALDFIVIELKKPLEYSVLREEKLVVRLGKEIPQPPVARSPAKSRVIKESEAIREPEIEITETSLQKEAGEEFFDEEKFPLVERYQIEAGDELEISVWQHPDLLRKMVVRPDGYVSFPLVGELNVSGLTTDKVAKEITIRLSRILRKPEVSVIVTGAGSKGVFVLGAVRDPGLYPYRTKMTVLKAVSSANSWQPHAWIKSVLVVRRFFEDESEVIRVNLWDVIKKGEIKKDIELQAGDIVYVPNSFIGNLRTFLDGLKVGFGTGAHYSIQ